MQSNQTISADRAPPASATGLHLESGFSLAEQALRFLSGLAEEEFALNQVFAHPAARTHIALQPRSRIERLIVATRSQQGNHCHGQQQRGLRHDARAALPIRFANHRVSTRGLDCVS